ncbi:phosphoribosylglycinamide formyltransferase [Pseudohongiella sp. SYSU M77423]|uniref:phosphoribosylglycinamide formyltransferase n=1 Tax=Pseudohongiella sp. SYSU M77423 TaxID=3042312 RepID=UPI000C56431D|nr:phosphoribosylglycinamide formyltransferase [Pseudohongiella sp. SYSU M77423]MAO39151.1 phosphoribosylglycinamide formyltransferase [Pseudohongiella sp.]MAY56056.1 phosphoribosylglycinamide formyltransferase [Gammaproteobacteria bacterium]MEC8860903.1 phosphoribosylglycinamide formyltransferase [Pseudomonadota bacterium]MBJ54878.1 phosphoribosylglycinamide formyltransferase [Gammaproteobacteria bacterium]MDH7944893.1 phosphoribosylglycinamide formyltransferase [Pseudohongiella sp. SYSU M774|tara:strand:+ start:5494 stop:6150 length:657 start_codon:yes stop_codon:yes gene_type:complete
MSQQHNSEQVCRVVVLISGNGSNLQALIDQQLEHGYRIAGVISNRADAYGLQRAADAGLASHVIDHKQFDSREAFDQEMIRVIDAMDINLVVLAGFMRILSSAFVQHYQGRLLNIHPSLLPAYKGTQTHQRVLEAGDREHGVSVHFVTEELDGGPVVRQAVIAVDAQDTVETLKQRIAEQEHRIYPEVVGWYASGRLTMTDSCATLDGNTLPPQGVRQ